MNVRYSIFALLLLAHTSTHPASAQETPAANNPAAPPTWETVPKRKLKPRDPPKDWARHSDLDHSVIWYSPTKPKKTERPGSPPVVIYDSRDGDIVLSLSCMKTNTRFLGRPKLFLDGLDDGFLGAYRRNGLNASKTPVAHVEYLHTIGRVLRVDVPGNKTTLKCDLTTPTQCYSIMAIGKPGKQLEKTFQTFIATLRFTSTEEKSTAAAP
jgi:hypothetical protein